MPVNHKLVVISPWEISHGELGDYPFSNFTKRYLVQGDSWFAFGAFPPTLTTNVLAEMELSRSTVAVNCATPGKVLHHMTDTTKERWFRRLLSGKLALRWDAILVSGGGNDLIDAAGVGPQAKPHERLLATAAERPAVITSPDDYLSETGWTTFATHLGAVFKALVDRRDSDDNNRHVPLVMHTYAHVMPRPAAVGVGFGPWLAPALSLFAVPLADWLAVSNALQDRLAQLLNDLMAARRVADSGANLHLVDTRQANLVLADADDTDESGDFINEIHPTRSGYDKAAAIWRTTLDALP